jgi:hypothetical protein
VDSSRSGDAAAQDLAPGAAGEEEGGLGSGRERGFLVAR